MTLMFLTITKIIYVRNCNTLKSEHPYGKPPAEHVVGGRRKTNSTLQYIKMEKVNFKVKLQLLHVEKSNRLLKGQLPNLMAIKCRKKRLV